MRRADCRGRSHCRDAGGNSDEATCAGCGRAGRSDINDDRHRRPKKALHDLLRGIEQPTGRVKLNDKTLSILRSGFVDAARNIARRGRPNRSVDINTRNLLSRENCGRASNPKDQRSDADGGASSASASTRCRSRIAGQASPNPPSASSYFERAPPFEIEMPEEVARRPSQLNQLAALRARSGSRSSALHFCLPFRVRCSTVRKVMLLSSAAA